MSPAGSGFTREMNAPPRRASRMVPTRKSLFWGTVQPSRGSRRTSPLEHQLLEQVEEPIVLGLPEVEVGGDRPGLAAGARADVTDEVLRRGSTPLLSILRGRLSTIFHRGAVRGRYAR
jgi:hypothetical protein